MSGNKKGGAKAAATNKILYGEDFYRKIGAIGGKKSKDEELVATIQDRAKNYILEVIRLNNKGKSK